MQPRIKIPRHMFVKAKSVDCLLALMNIQNSITHCWSWPWNYCLSLDSGFRLDASGSVVAAIPTAIRGLAEDAANELMSLIDGTNFKTFSI